MPDSLSTVLPVKQTTRDQIAAVLQAEIISGRYQPGQRLVERDLSVRFGVSSIPIREALQSLENQGLIVKQPNRGCSVVNLSPDEIDELCELREHLEPKVAEWAACRLNDAGARRLDAQAAKLKAAADAQNVADFYEQDMCFHRLIWELSGNAFAARALESVVGSLFASGLRGSHEIDLRQEYRKHERLLRALTEGRPSDAAMLLGSIAGSFRGKLRMRAAEMEMSLRMAPPEDL